MGKNEPVHPRFVKVKNAENIYFCTIAKTYYLIEQKQKKRTYKSTGVKGEVKIQKNRDGTYSAKALKGLGAAKEVIEELRSKSFGPRSRPLFTYFSDLTLEIQKNKAPRTYIIAKDGDKNLRPFFERECPYLDNFEKNYEQIWARYQVYQKKEKPGRKLAHDRKYLITVLRRARKQKAISTDFIKSDFPLDEISDPIGRALEDREVKQLLQAANELKNEKIYQQIMLAVTMGLRKSEILQLAVIEIDLKTREIDLNPKRLKIRKRREVPIPIHDDVWPIIKELVSEAEGKFLFPKVLTSIKGRPVDWNHPQVDNSSVFDRVRTNAKIKCRFHDLRHTCITNLVAERIPLATISKIMGASIHLVNKIYDHVTKKTKSDLKKLRRGRFKL